MSRKTRRNQAGKERPDTPARELARANATPGIGMLVGSIVALLLLIGAGTLLFQSKGTNSSEPAAATSQAALASEHSPTLGDSSARVHIVEFLDPACETCALFFPFVKELMAANPGRIRLSVRHVAFHEGSEYVVRILEASRRQDKYWQTLEALLASQSRWAPHHTVQPDLVWPALAGVGLNVQQLMTDMDSPDVTQRMQQDRNDAVALKVTATPEYFVNGRSLPSFGQQQLQDLVDEALRNAY